MTEPQTAEPRTPQFHPDDRTTDATQSPYDDPEFQRDLKEGIEEQIQGWRRDWSVRVDALMEALGLSRSEVMLYLLLMRLTRLTGMASGFRLMWNGEPEKRRRAMQDQLLEMELQVNAKALGLELQVEEPALSPGEAVKQAVQAWKIR